jgi:MFS-type transporter involved in bile tolerance (Atg22 family)
MMNKIGIRQTIGLDMMGLIATTLLLVSPLTSGFRGCIIISILYGGFLGGTFPAFKSYYAVIIPSGKETEMQGLYYFAILVFAWIPTTVFVSKEPPTQRFAP